ncbi:MAG: PTS sugar transporter subunit IIA [Calditrichaceae bacterium]
MRLTDILLSDYIKIPLDAKNRDEAIKNLIALLGEHEAIEDTDQAYKAVLDREKIMTTGVGNGIAIPHCKDSNPGLHIKLLSRISRLMSNEDLREEILDCKTAEEALNLLQEEENYYFDLD